MLDLRIMADGHPCTPLELPLKIGRAAAVAEISDQIEALIAALDRLDGDTDVEPNGDELDGSMGEDDFTSHNVAWPMPGCPVSDPAEDDDPAGDPLDLGEELSNDGSSMLLELPKYDVDQRQGPVNFGQALNAYLTKIGGRT